MPTITELDAVKLLLTTAALKLKLPLALSRVAGAISTSPGELARVGTLMTRFVSESWGNT
jgi:hypothetical protein